jgi:hypothetical protein
MDKNRLPYPFALDWVWWQKMDNLIKGKKERGQVLITPTPILLGSSLPVYGPLLKITSFKEFL